MRRIFVLVVCLAPACFSGGRDTPPLHGTGVVHIDEKTQEVSLDPAVPAVLACPNDSLVHKGANGVWECVAKAPAAVQADGAANAAHATNADNATNATHATSADQLGGAPAASFAKLDSTGNLDAAQGRLVVSNAAGTSRTSIGGIYCGSTGPTSGRFRDPSNGSAVGYRAAKLQCENVDACGKSPLAHMCTSAEMIYSIQIGAIPSTGSLGWIATLTLGASPSYGYDCDGYLDDTTAQISGAVVNFNLTGSGPYGYSHSCADANVPILCCK